MIPNIGQYPLILIFKNRNYVLSIIIINHLKIGMMFVSMYLSIYIFAIVTTPLNPQLRNFGTTFLMWLFKKDSQAFWKKCFFQSYWPFSIFFKDFSVNFKINYGKAILFSTKIIGQRQIYTRPYLSKHWQVFFLSLMLDFEINHSPG